MIASEIALSSTNSKGTIGVALAPSGGVLPAGSTLLKVSLTGGAKFGTAVTTAAVVANGACAPSTVLSTGGGVEDSSVTFLVSGLNTCTSALPIHLKLPVQLTSQSAVNVETVLTTEAGTPIDGGFATTYDSAAATPAGQNLISFAKAFKVETVADTVTTAATLASGFKALTTDVALGQVDITVSPFYRGVDLATGAVGAQAALGDVTSGKFTVKGDLSTVNVLAAGTAVSATTGVRTITSPTASTVFTAGIKAPVAGDPAFAIKSSAYTVETQLTLDAAKGYATQAAGAPAAIQTITREGASYLLPWVASGTLSTTSTSNTVVRIANLGDATGAVSLELLTSSKGVAASTTLVPVASSIAKGGELVLTSQSLQDTLGADFGRGDIRVTVEGQPQNLIVRRFVQSTVNGALSEVSLGRSSTGQEPQN